MAALSELQKQYKIDTFEKLKMDDPFEKILRDQTDNCSHNIVYGKGYKKEDLDLDTKYLGVADQ